MRHVQNLRADVLCFERIHRTAVLEQVTAIQCMRTMFNSVCMHVCAQAMAAELVREFNTEECNADIQAAA